MALFRKNEGLAELLKRLQSVADTGGPELEPLLQAVVAHPDAQPGRLAWLLTAGHPKARERGREVVARAATAETAAVLLAAMVGRDSDVRAELAGAVLRCEPGQVQRALAARIAAREPPQRRVVFDVIAAAPRWSDWLGHLKRGLRDADADTRFAAVRIVCRAIDDPTARLILSTLIHDHDRRIRLAVIHAFCRQPDVDIVEPFFAHLPRAGADEQEAMVEALGRLAKGAGHLLEDHLLPVLAADDASLRRLAVRLLVELPDRREVLRAFLVRSRGLAPWLRERATAALLEMADALLDTLVELMADGDVDVRVGAMMLASRVEDPRIVPAVRQIFAGDADWWVRSMAVDILTRFPGPDLVDLLMSRFDDPELRYTIISALGKLDLPDAQWHLVACLGEKRPGLRSAALGALVGHANKEVARAVFRVAQVDAEARVRDKAQEVLRGFGAPARKLVEALELHRRERVARLADAALELHMMRDELNRSAATTGSA